MATTRSRRGQKNEESNALTALTQQQVNSYPALQKAISLSGEKLPTGNAPDPEKQRKDNFLQLARERFKACVDAEAKRRLEMQIDNQFHCGVQWDASIQQQRDSQKRPCLTINRIPGFIKRVVNNMRQERPAIKVDPVGNGSDEEQAEIRQGLIRHTEVNSQADVPYDISFENMCVMGLGWMRVVDDWASADSFDKDLYIRAVPNTFSVYSDPFVQQPDWSDMKFAFVVEDLTRQEFIDQYGDKAECVSRNDFSSIGDQGQYWFPGGKIRVAEYFWIEQEKDILCELDNASTKLWSELKDLKVDTLTGEEPLYRLEVDSDNDRMIVSDDGYSGRTRDCKIPRCHWAVISAVDILRERKWKGKFIPLIPVIGNQTELDGDKLIVGMVRYAREPQRMYNYMYSTFVETVALAPKAPFLAEVDQVPDGIYQEWATANSQPTAVLRYKHKVTEKGDILPAPHRESASPDVGAFVQGLQMADANLKAVFSIYEASLGQRGPQESGKAINARKVESDTATYDWGDNFIRALRYLGMVLDDLLQYYYNTPGRIVQIDREDNTKREVTLNQEVTEKGEIKKYDLSNGKYSVVISTGPSFQTRREQSAASMLEMAKIIPAIGMVAPDLMVREQDWPGKDAIADRLKKGLPPGIAEDEESDEAPIPPQFKATLDQAMQQVQQLTQLLGAATDENNRERMKEEYATLREQMKQEVTLAVAELKVGSEEAKFMNAQIFSELQQVRAALQPQTVGTPSKPEGSTPSSVPTPTVGANPSVGGIQAPGNQGAA